MKSRKMSWLSKLPPGVALRRVFRHQNRNDVARPLIFFFRETEIRRFSDVGRPTPDFQGAKFEQIISDFQTKGVVCIRNVFDKNWQKIAQSGIEKSFSEPSDYCDWLVGEGGKGVYFNDYMKWDKIDDVRRYVMQSPAASLAGRLMQSEVSGFVTHDH